ncbi:YheC/YheD family endospore coat-associated protein [Paenibacillus koleovorans]|uniref:YheC/YheD family endospore coat-associated protein n=1 Tax=Paenibacillus koleovorans TaxID=121608 RepID=UPI000FDB2F2B|nr:YheC/YheD family protein [Paenibacillus koleovorans]
MSLTLCSIQFAPRTDRVVHMSTALAKALQLTSTNMLTMKMGSRTASVSLRMTKKPGKHIILPLSVKSQLMVPRSGQITVQASGTKEVQLGPLIGILANGTGSVTQPFGVRSSMLKSYISAGSKTSYYFAFLPSDIDWQAETVVAYFPNGTGWIRKTVPLPDAVYNRLSNRRVDRSISMDQLKDRFVRRGIGIFNWSFFDKSDVYKLLEEDKEANKHVPESHNNPSPDRIREMLEKHRFVYLKPTAGSLGIGIYRLTYHPKRGYFVRFRRGGKNVLFRFNNTSGLFKLLNGNGRMRNYVVQQGIRLIEIDACPIDFRFHLNKNGNNQWVVAGIGAKKAGKGSVTTHVKNGGQVMTPEYVLDRVFGAKAEGILEDAKQSAIKLAESIEKHGRRNLGELGLDIGIDQNERVWMFEANSKPGRSIFKHPALKAQGNSSLKYIAEHLAYLGKFRSRRES